MLTPFLVIGVGGSGNKTLRALRQNLQRRLEEAGWDGGWPEAWQLLSIDSPPNQDDGSFPAPFLNTADYIGLVPAGVNYAAIYNHLLSRVDPKQAREIERPLPSPAIVKVDVTKGAGQYRAIGRTIAASYLSEIQSKVRDAISRMQSETSGNRLSDLAKALGGANAASGKKPDPTVLIVSSVAGGSGAGMFIDVTEAAKAAIGQEVWANRIFSILFAPDVFVELGDEAMVNIAPNSLGAISELMSGFWSKGPVDSTTALYRGQGVLKGTNVETTVGPRYNYIVGRTNGRVDFASQWGTYMAVATSIAAWVADENIQNDLLQYTVANFDSRASSARNLPDKTELKLANSASPPFSSMGFARLSLGMDKFKEYASERLAKQALETMLKRHLEADSTLSEKTEEQWIQFHADINEGDFVNDSGLNEITESNNQVIEALVPDTQELDGKLRAGILASVQQGMPRGGHSFNDWVIRICNAYENYLPGLADELQALRHARIRSWTDAIPDQILKLISKSISQQGLPVTIELTKRLISQSNAAAEELIQEKSRFLNDSLGLQKLVSAALGAAPKTGAIDPSHPLVQQALHQTQVTFYYRAMADLRDDGSVVLKDLVKNFLEPLLKKLTSSYVTLRERINDPKLLDGRTNPYGSWPTFSVTEVAQKYKPAPNERLLFDYDEFPDLFDQKVIETVNDPQLDARREVIDQLLMGAHGSIGQSNQDSQRLWKIIDISQKWVPQERKFQSRQASPQPAQFDMLSDHLAFVEIAKLWLQLPGRAFRAQLDLKLADYLAAGADQSLQASRQRKFLSEFEAVAAASSPLVGIDSILLGQVHTQDSGDPSVLCSAIPVAIGTELYDAMKEKLLALDLWTDQVSDGWFVGVSDGAQVRNIELFSTTKNQLQPIVMGSVMQRIAEEWATCAPSEVSRNSFMKWRRGRTLAEAIPAQPEVWGQMLRGWYVTRLLSQVESVAASDSSDERGPKVSVWVDNATGFSSFPYPLFYPSSAPKSDYPGIILESLSIALVKCFETKSLEPLTPYKRLSKLGQQSGDSELANWIREGSLQRGAPLPNASRAGSPENTFEERQQLARQWLTEQLEKFKADMAKHDENTKADVRTYPVTWEIKSQVEVEILSLIALIDSLDSETDEL